MATLEEMLAKANASDNPYNEPQPLYNKAMAVVNNNSLTLAEKKQAIDELALQATGYEAERFADVYEALIVSAESMGELGNINQQDNN